MNRADELLVSRGLAESRTAAQKLIRAGRVLVNGETFDKPSRRTSPQDHLEVLEPQRYVSRGGEKLDFFLRQFGCPVSGKHMLDAGASTGGFTDCLLQHGAASVTALDVGRGQLHPRLQADARVTSLEGINARQLDAISLSPDCFDGVVADLSFISLTLVLEPLWNRVKPQGCLIVLIKPQFEAGKDVMDACKGVLRDPLEHAKALQKVIDAASRLPAASLIGSCPSPIEGGDGNREFLAGWKKEG